MVKEYYNTRTCSIINEKPRYRSVAFSCHEHEKPLNIAAKVRIFYQLAKFWSKKPDFVKSILQN